MTTSSLRKEQVELKPLAVPCLSKLAEGSLPTVPSLLYHPNIMGMGVQLPRTLRTTTLVSRTVLLRITGPRRTYLTQAQKDREISGPIIHIPPPKSSNDIVKVSLIHYGRLLTKRASMSTNPNEPVEVQRRREKEEMKIPIFGALIEKDGKGHLWDLGLTKVGFLIVPCTRPPKERANH
jgi:hypothetical protein